MTVKATIDIDPDPFIEELEGKLGEKVEEMGREAAGRWFSKSQETLMDRGDEYAYDMWSIVRAAQPPNEIKQGVWQFVYSHFASIFFEVGTAPHEIKAVNVDYLRFEWPDAPPEIKEQFKNTPGDIVYFKKVNHPGTPALNYLRDSREEIGNWLGRQTIGEDID